MNVDLCRADRVANFFVREERRNRRRRAGVSKSQKVKDGVEIQDY